MYLLSNGCSLHGLRSHLANLVATGAAPLAKSPAILFDFMRLRIGERELLTRSRLARRNRATSADVLLLRYAGLLNLSGLLLTLLSEEPGAILPTLVGCGFG